MLREWSHRERALFIRFAWGRNRLPKGRWGQHFTITRLEGPDGENSLPISHTCFFQLELPAYSTVERMREKLGICISFGLGGMLLH